VDTVPDVYTFLNVQSLVLVKIKALVSTNHIYQPIALSESEQSLSLKVQILQGNLIHF